MFSSVLAVRIDDIGTQQHFRSYFGYSKEQAFDARELPSGVVDLYYACPSTPHLADFDKYREDGRKSLRLYTDSSYFFTLWLEEQKRMMEKVHHILSLHNRTIEVTYAVGSAAWEYDNMAFVNCK